MDGPVTAVRLIVLDRQGRVLLLRRQGTDYAAGHWTLPGGKVDYGETLEQAAIRELEEETSLICSVPKFVFFQDSLPAAPGQMHCLNMYFECDYAGEVVLDAESSNYAWVAQDDVDNYEIAFNNDAGLTRYWNEQA